MQFSTGGAIGMTPEERASVLELRPEMATLTCGSVNFGDDIFENSFPIMRGILQEDERVRRAAGARDFRQGTPRQRAPSRARAPAHASRSTSISCWASPAASKRPLQNLCDLVDDLPAGCTWSVAGIGRQQLPMAMAAIAMGGHVRVGLEDNLYYSSGRLARNEELVARVARIAAEAGRPVATPDQARKLLGLRSRLRGERALNVQ